LRPAVIRRPSDERAGATLGIVTGRRRQGKTFLLRALCEAAGGFYFAADEATDGESLHAGKRVAFAPALAGGGSAGRMFD
jgi:hypothetical protein